MVEEGQAQQPRGIAERGGHEPVGPARRDLAARVVVGDDQGGGAGPERGASTSRGRRRALLSEPATTGSTLIRR